MSSTLALYRPRTDFRGTTDKYSPAYVSVVGDRMDEALRGVAPANVGGSVLTDDYVRFATLRLAAYRDYANAYSGAHFQNPVDGGDENTVFNFCRTAVRKRAAWAAGKGFVLHPVKGNELVSDIYQGVWATSGGRMLIRKTAATALAYGDAFWYFTVDKQGVGGKELPRSQWSVKVAILNPAYVFPTWSERNPNELASVLIQFPIYSAGSRQADLFSCVIDPLKITYYKNSDVTSEVPNAMGLIPVCHIPSEVFADNKFGTSALIDVAPLNRRYNLVMQAINRIIKYHGEPTTIITGASMRNAERGANKVWSNFPADAKVFNLEMQGDLSSFREQAKALKAEMREAARIPAFCLDPENLSTSNVTGTAMAMMYGPLIEATEELQDSLSAAILRGNQIIAAIHDKIFGAPLTVLADEADRIFDMTVYWKSLLPKDEQLELDNAAKKIAMGIWSKAEAARRLSDVQDTERLCVELAADARQELAIVAEKARALKGEEPEVSATFLGSMFLSEDLLDLATESDSIADDTSESDSPNE